MRRIFRRENRGMTQSERDQRVSSLELHPRVLSALKRGIVLFSYLNTYSYAFFACIFVCTAGLHKLSSVLRYSEGDLVRRTGLASGDVHRVVQVVSAAALSSCHSYTALQLYQNEAALPNWGTGVNIYIPSALTPTCYDES